MAVGVDQDLVLRADHLAHRGHDVVAQLLAGLADLALVRHAVMRAHLAERVQLAGGMAEADQVFLAACA